MPLRVLAPAARSLDRALGLGPALLERARVEQAPQLAASLIDEGPAVVLGALQRRGRVVNRAACSTMDTTVLRRETTGTAVYLRGRALIFTLALPSLSTLAPDATPRTLLNRNVRGFLDGFRRAGALAHYFGREWLAVGKRPAAILGFEVLPEGTTLIEVFAGIDAPLALPEALVTEAERAVDRWLGKAPAALTEGMEAADPRAIAERVLATVAARAGLAIEAAPEPIEDQARPSAIADDDPAPPGFTFAEPLRVPIGWVDAASHPETGQLWLGGDLLCATFAVRAIAEAIAAGAASPWKDGEVPLDGATVADLAEAARGSRRANLPASTG